MKAVFSALTEIPEAFRAEYEAGADGKFHLKIEGEPVGYVKASELAAANGKVVDFRNRNVELLKDLATLSGVASVPDDAPLGPLKAKLEALAGIDPDEFKTLKAKAAALEAKGVKGVDDLDARFKTLLDATVNPLKAELAAEKEGRAKAQLMADQATLRQAVAQRFLDSKVGGKAKALDYIVGQAAQAFRVEGGEVKAQPNRFSPKNPTEPLTIEDWIASMATEADFAFEVSKGGGAIGSPNGIGGPRAGVRELVNPTPQQLGDPNTAKAIREGTLQIVNR